MAQTDEVGLALTGASPAAAAAWREALNGYYLYAGDPMALLGAATDDSPGFVMGHVMKAYLTLAGTNAKAAAIGLAAYEAAKDLPANGREKGHLAAVAHMARGELRAAGRVLEDVSIAEPLDGVALQAGQLIDFLVGDARMLRDRIGRALPSWSEAVPHYHAVLGMMAFGLEETGLYDRAEAAGRKAIDLEPRNGWARHAVAHVLEMQDRRADGVAWMRGDVEAWTGDNYFQVHNWWHLALFHMGLGEAQEALAIYDGPIFGQPSGMTFDMVDAAALLWRLELAGTDVGGRWEGLADAYEELAPWGSYAFDDFHGVAALVGAGRMQAAKAVVSAQEAALATDLDNAVFVGEVGLPAMRGLLAFGEERYGEAADLLRGVRNRANRFGGSHAQRDLIDLTIIEAARRGGNTALEKALRDERAMAAPLAL